MLWRLVEWASPVFTHPFSPAILALLYLSMVAGVRTHCRGWTDKKPCRRLVASGMTGLAVGVLSRVPHLGRAFHPSDHPDIVVGFCFALYPVFYKMLGHPVKQGLFSHPVPAFLTSSDDLLILGEGDYLEGGLSGLQPGKQRKP
jgi:hypothetical protein